MHQGLLDTAPGAGKSYTFTLYRRVWDVVGADTALSVPIADTATGGGDDVNEVSAADYDQIRMKVNPSGTPALTRSSWGLVMELPALPTAGFGGTTAEALVKAGLI